MPSFIMKKIFILIVLCLLSYSAFAQKTFDSKIYVFFDQAHSFVQKKDTLLSTNYISVDFNIVKEATTNIFGSENFCKNIFYFSDNKIIFYNPSVYMSSAVWCQVQLTNIKTKKVFNYKFILNKTFSQWCEEKESNKSIGKTVKAILNIFDSKTCNEDIEPILAQTKVLNLSNMDIDDISPVAGFLKVRSLWLDNNKIEDVDALGSMQRLVFLSLNNNYISDVKSLGDMNGLKWVFLNNNQILNADFVFKLKSLKFLGMNGNLIEDPAPFYKVSSSTFVLAKGNPFVKTVCKFHKAMLYSKNQNSYYMKNCMENTHT